MAERRDDERDRLAVQAIRGLAASALIAALAGALNGILVTAALLALVGVAALVWSLSLRK